jgi:hypothetical protein
VPAKKKPEPVKVINTIPKADAAPKADVHISPVADFFDKLGNKAPLLAAGLILFIGFIVFKDFLLGEKAYFFKDIGSDSYNLSYPSLHLQCEYIAKYGIPKWSFYNGMGQSLFPFFLRDPFDIFLYIAGKEHILYGMVYIELLKIILGGLVFYYYLKYLNLSAYTALMGSILFAFCGFTILGSSWYIFSFEAFNMALLLLAYEQLVAKQKWFLFPIAIFLICISQPFNLYVYGLFLVAYSILRHFQTNTFSVKNIGSLYLKMIGLGGLGMLLSAPFMIENIVQLLESPRGNGTNSLTNVLSATPMFSIADPLQLGTSVMRFFSTDLLGNGTDFKGWTNYLEAPMFYCGIPCLLLLPQVFQFLEKRVRIAFLIFIAVWIIPIIFPYFRRAFWLFTGDYYRAFSFIVSFFFIFYSLQALEFIVQRKKINLIILIITIVALFGLLNYPFFEDKEIVNPAISVFVSVALIIYACLLFFMSKPGSPVYLKYTFFGAVVCELIFLSSITVNDRKALTTAELSQKITYNDYTIDAVKYINSIDSSFYRMDKTYASSTAIHYSINDAMAQDYRGTSCYNPFNQEYYIMYLQLMGISDKRNEIESRWALGLASHPILEAENRVKYMLAKTNANPLWQIVCDPPVTIGDVHIFRNKYVLPVGYTYSHYLKESTFGNVSKAEIDFVTLQTCIVKDADVAKVAGLKEFQLKDSIPQNGFSTAVYKQCIDELKKDTLIISRFDETILTGKADMSEDKMMYLSIPIDAGWMLKVDGQVRDKIILDGGMTGIVLTKGSHTIEMAYDLRYFRKGLMLCLLGAALYAGLWFYTRKRKQDIVAN